MANVDFKYGEQSAYAGLTGTTTGTIYFATEEAGSHKGGSMYRGDGTKDGEIFGTTVADKLVLPEDLEVYGVKSGTFADPNIEDGYKFNAGTSVMDVLRTLLSKEIWPTNANCRIPNSFNASNQAISNTVSNAGKIVVVGTSISFGEVVSKNPTYTATSITFSGFDYGYKSSATATSLAGTGNPSSVTYNVTQNTSTVYSLKADYTGFSSASDTTVTGNYGSMPSIAATSHNASLGTNSVTYTLSANSNAFTATPEETGEYYPVSNMGNYDSTQANVVSTENADTINSSTPVNKTVTYTVTGAYPVYYSTGTTGNGTQLTLGTSAVYKFTIPAGCPTLRVIYPGNRTCTVAFGSPLDQNDSTRWTNQNGTSTSYSDYSVNSKEYQCWTINGEIAEGEYRITLSKNTITE